MLATPAPANTLTMCLLHGDYHPMAQDCWATSTDWFFTHTHLEGQEARDAYLEAVERRMLDNLLETLR